MTEKQRKQKIYNAKSISALAKHLGLTTASIHTWKRGTYRVDGETIESPKLKLKCELVMLGWQEKCKQELK